MEKINKKKELLIEEKPKKEENELQNEPKKYINCGCFQISIGIILTYIYIFISIFLNLNNRIIYHKYNFRYNFSFLLIQQFFSMLFFSFVNYKSKLFQKQTGEISINDFFKFKYYYFFFCLIFICNMLSSFYGNQLVLNVSMFVTLRKLVLVMIFFIDFFLYKKPIKLFTILCIFLITIGTILVSMDDFNYDYLGYFVVIINNSLTIIYIKFSENFKKKTGVTSLKLLVYNSYLSIPILLSSVFISGEYKNVYFYFINNIYSYNFYYFFIFLFISCFLCVFLNSSLFLSNEKNSSLFTQLLSNSKDILISFLSYFILKNNNLTIKIIIGLILSTVGAIFISMKSISENLIFGKLKNKSEDKEGKELEEKELEDKEKV